ncbi:MAG: T9SS type A sorting domain-containing protein [Candidatus Kapaibacteriota bacterium]
MNVFLYFFTLCFLYSISAIAQPTRFESRGMGGGATFHSLSIAPTMPYTLRVSGTASQMFTSTDLGISWNAYPHATIAGGSTAGNVTFTSSSQILYAISEKDGDYIPIRSNDGGRSWNPINDPTFGGAYYIHADPASTNRLIVSDYTDVYFSSDGGANWTIAVSEITDGADGCYVAGVLFDGTYIMIATQAGIYTSDDDGLTFIKDSFYEFPKETGIISFTYGTSGNLYRLACLTGPMEMLYPGIEPDEITAYDDLYVMDVINGQSGDWISRKSTLPSTMLPTHLSMAMNDPTRIYLAGTNTANEPVILRSINGGNTFASIFKTTDNANIATGWIGSGSTWDWTYAGTPMTFSLSSKNPQIIAFGDYASLHISTNGGDSWKQAYLRTADEHPQNTQIPSSSTYQTNGLENTTVHHILHADSTIVLAGIDGGGIIRSSDNGISWKKITIPSRFSTCYAIEQSGEILYAAVSSLSNMYSIGKVTDLIINAAPSAILQSSDKGNTWSIVQEFPSPITSLCIDPQNPEKLYAGLAHSTNGGILVNTAISGGGTWKSLANPPRTEGHPHTIKVLKDGTLIASFTARRNGTVLTQSAGVYSSLDGGTTWTDHSIDAMKTWTTSITIDPHDPYRNTWLVSTWSDPTNANDNSGGVYRTTNRGRNWTRIVTLPFGNGIAGRVNTCAINPAQNGQMYVATETHGLYFSQNAQASNPTSAELANVFPARASKSIAYNPKAPWELYIGTVGNGLRFGKSIIPQLPYLISSFPMRDTLIVYEKGMTPQLTIHTQWNSAQNINLAQARFSNSRTFSKADTIDILNLKTNHVPGSVPGADSIWYMQSRIGNTSGWSAWSEIIAITFREVNTGNLPIITLLQPKSDTVIQYLEGEKPVLVISWSAKAEDSISNSQVRFSINENFVPKADTVNAGIIPSISLPSTIPGADSIWYMQVRAENRIGWGPWTERKKLTFSKKASSDIQEEIDAIKLMPNPVDDMLLISSNTQVAFSVYSMTGEEILKGKTGIPLNISGIPAGLYLVRFDQINAIMRFIKE